MHQLGAWVGETPQQPHLPAGCHGGCDGGVIGEGSQQAVGSPGSQGAAPWRRESLTTVQVEEMNCAEAGRGPAIVAVVASSLRPQVGCTCGPLRRALCPGARPLSRLCAVFTLELWKRIGMAFHLCDLGQVAQPL